MTNQPDYQAAYERLAQTMRGIVSCATACECCSMHQRIAAEAVDAAAALVHVPVGTIDPAIAAMQARIAATNAKFDE